MRLLALLSLLIASFGLAAAARALPPPPQGPPPAVIASQPEGEAEEGEEAEEAVAAEEAEACEPEETGRCAEEEAEEEVEEAGECVLERASTHVSASADGDRVRVTVRYTASAAATFTLDYSLRGNGGKLRLGGARARFHRSGAFHDSVAIGRRDAARVLAARRFVVELHPVGTPGFCRDHLSSAAAHRASLRHPSGGRGRSGAPARTPGR